MGSGSGEQVEPGWQEAAPLASPSHHRQAVRSTRLSSEAQIRNRLFPKTRSWFALEAPLELLSPLSVVRILFGLNIVTWGLATLLLHTSSVKLPAVAFIVGSAILIWLILELVHRLDSRWLVVFLTVSSAPDRPFDMGRFGNSSDVRVPPVGHSGGNHCGPLPLPTAPCLVNSCLASSVSSLDSLPLWLCEGLRRCLGRRTCRPLDGRSPSVSSRTPRSANGPSTMTPGCRMVSVCPSASDDPPGDLPSWSR